MSNIVQHAKQIVYHSSIVNYISEEKVEEAFRKITIYDTQDELLKEYGNDKYSNKLEGFNRSSGIYLGPYSTVHTVIHEVLHEISSEFDENGHRIKNGLMGDEIKFNFANQINEGVTDYLASKLSAENPRHYIQGHKLFSKLEPMLIKYTSNPDILMQAYLQNDVKFLQSFLNHFGKEKTFENLYSNFLYMEDEQMNKTLEIVEKNLNKYIKKKERRERHNKFLSKVKGIFRKKEEPKLLLADSKETINTHEEFIKKHNIEENNKYQSKSIRLEVNTKENTYDKGEKEL